jgi:hypothetical protein
MYQSYHQKSRREKIVNIYNDFFSFYSSAYSIFSEYLWTYYVLSPLQMLATVSNQKTDYFVPIWGKTETQIN